ncbi:MAG: type I restriction endonuclease [Candidatus Gastranaerophilaceae bacterium]
MEFIEKIRVLSERVESMKQKLGTEEATKNALIMPFLQMLGYDVFNPSEVVPEFIADVGIKKGEKVDYAIMQNNKPVILIECKKIEDGKLDIRKHSTQLIRYFMVTDAKFIILTNGVLYKFFTDIEQTGKLDTEPFFTFNLLDFKLDQVEQLQEFCKGEFNIDKAFLNASNLKYISRFEDVLKEEYENPSTDFVKYLITKSGIGEKRITPAVVEKHTHTTIEAFNQFMSATVKKALEGNINQSNTIPENQKKDETKSLIETTVEELEGYAIVKSILKDTIDLNRLFYRDTINYFNLILDDNIRKTICRLYFNNKQKYICFLENNKEEKHPLDTINDIFKFEKKLIDKAKFVDETYCKK